ncbi:hypothetical protein Sfr7A_09880 [Streptomyces xinghaiensis]|uniref:Uncharacterized protein n=1 Tax=Streptomyces xinghaiensis TaxID=1038928 RepID=A0A3M8F5Y8_9ACTN|nr:hypothetical protein Sfr7A_09880 [Streptomyces xinghaiensis]RKM92004.1 hypothetical protein SFRA_026540 [Streptomyces xinghaiensis]RNC73577.1 hypothetical protein DC095_016000 [Streptomyces xinghaiensis]
MSTEVSRRNWLPHTSAHILIRDTALTCGYSAATPTAPPAATARTPRPAGRAGERGGRASHSVSTAPGGSTSGGLGGRPQESQISCHLSVQQTHVLWQRAADQVGTHVT